MTPTPPVAPSATPTTSPSAPSAPAADPTRLEYYDRLAAEALTGTPETPANVPGPEPPPETPPAPEPAAPAADPNAPPATPAAPAEPGAPAAEDDAEPSPEEQAGWSEGEKRMHSALRKEREKRKEARTELKSLREQFAALEAKVNASPPQPAPTPPDGAAPAPTAPAPAPAAMAGHGPLADCDTFEAIDARVMAAGQMEAKAVHLQTLVGLGQRDAVLKALTGEKVAEIDGVPLAEASDVQLSQFLAGVHGGAVAVREARDGRKLFLQQQAQSWHQATQILPELASDPKSERARQFAALANQNPQLRQLGPHWPELLATQILGLELRGKNKPVAKPPATATVTTPPPPPPPPRPAPGAPRTSAAAVPQPKELEALRAKLANGTATLAEADRYAVLCLAAQPA